MKSKAVVISKVDGATASYEIIWNGDLDEWTDIGGEVFLALSENKDVEVRLTRIDED